MSLRTTNLNLMPILQALLRERNLSKAAATLGLTQPAVSAALTRLRGTFDDPLLVREGRGMVLTLRAHQLIEPVERICTALEDVLGSEAFDPLKSTRTFIIMASDHSVVTLAPQLLRTLARIAPGIVVHFADTPHRSLEPHPGEADFLMVPRLLLSERTHPQLRWTTLANDEFVTVVAEDDPIGKHNPPTRAELLALRYVIYYPALSLVDGQVASAVSGAPGDGRQIVARIQQFSLLPMLVLETRCAAIMPRRIADYMAVHFPVRIVDDGPLPIQIEIALCWHVRSDGDPGIRWFRRQILSACADLRT